MGLGMKNFTPLSQNLILGKKLGGHPKSGKNSTNWLATAPKSWQISYLSMATSEGSDWQHQLTFRMIYKEKELRPAALFVIIKLIYLIGSRERIRPDIAYIRK